MLVLLHGDINVTFDNEKDEWSLEAHKYLSAGHHLFATAQFVMQMVEIDAFRPAGQSYDLKNMQKITLDITVMWNR